MQIEEYENSVFQWHWKSDSFDRLLWPLHWSSIPTDKQMVKTGVVGLSLQGFQHIEAIRAHGDFNLVGICDRDNIILSTAERRFDCDAFDNIDSMLESLKLDALILCLPHHEYENVIDKVVSKGIHILKEKPLARNVQEAKTFLSKAQGYQVKLGVAAQRRFHQSYQLAKKALRFVGVPQCVRITHADNKPRQRPAWRYSRELAGGGALLDIGYHLLDIATWYFGRPERIYLTITQGEEIIETTDGVEETAFVLMQLPETAVCQLFISRQSSPKSEQIVINGSRGHLLISRSTLEFLSPAGVVIDRREFNPDWSEAMKSQLDDFHRLIDGDEDCLTNAQTHFTSVELVQAIYDCEKRF